MILTNICDSFDGEKNNVTWSFQSGKVYSQTKHFWTAARVKCIQTTKGFVW